MKVLVGLKMSNSRPEERDGQIDMADYIFEPQDYRQYTYISNYNVTARIDIYAYLGHPVFFYFVSGGQQFTGSIAGLGPEQYTFYCFSNNMDFYNKLIAGLGQEGPKRVIIIADSAIPDQGAFNIPITAFALTNEIAPGGVSVVQAQSELQGSEILSEHVRRSMEEAERMWSIKSSQ